MTVFCNSCQLLPGVLQCIVHVDGNVYSAILKLSSSKYVCALCCRPKDGGLSARALYESKEVAG